MRGPTHVWLVWDYGISDGGTPIIDYDIYYDQGINDFVYVDTTVYNRYLMTPLTMGYTYRYKLTARNSYGTSQSMSDVSAILTATTPEPPNGVTTITQNPDNIYVYWTAAVNNGHDIT